MAKIAVEYGCDAGLPAPATTADALHARMIAKGADWWVEDIVCTAGPRDRRFEERHSETAIGLVLSGTFQYQVAGPSRSSGVLMTPGSLLLGNAGQSFECGHEHASGDHCLSFRYSQDYFERIAVDSNAPQGEREFRIPRVPPVRRLSQLVAMACAKLSDRTPLSDVSEDLVWEEIALRLAAEALAIANGLAPHLSSAQPSTLARVTRVVRRIERDLSSPLSLRNLAQEARLSPYHFLGVFQQVTGLTPHKYVRRARLRNAGIQLKKDTARVLDIALDCGFGDVSSFNRAFQKEFGTNPLGFRREAGLKACSTQCHSSKRSACQS